MNILMGFYTIMYLLVGGAVVITGIILIGAPVLLLIMDKCENMSNKTNVIIIWLFILGAVITTLASAIYSVQLAVILYAVYCLSIGGALKLNLTYTNKISK